MDKFYCPWWASLSVNVARWRVTYLVFILPRSHDWGLTNLARDLYCAYVCAIKDRLRTVLQAIILSQWRNINWWLLEVSENNRKSSVVAPSRIYIKWCIYVDMVDVVKMLMIEYTTHDFFLVFYIQNQILSQLT